MSYSTLRSQQMGETGKKIFFPPVLFDTVKIPLLLSRVPVLSQHMPRLSG